METKQKIESSLKDAMRAGDDVRRRTLRMVLAGIKNSEIDKGGSLEEPVIIAILQKEIKSRREAIQEAQKANRPDLEADSQAEIRVLEDFLPRPLADEELRSLVEQTIAETQAAAPSDMGKVMKALQPKLLGRAPGDKVSAMVKALLQK
jgi:uncharacterized protein YqeY